MIYLITYDLMEPGKDYSGIYKALKSFKRWCHYLGSTWLIDTDVPITEIHNKLKPYIDENDNLLIIEVKDNYKGQLPKEAWEWLNNS
jgi:CRISPR/Cas system-associated endoribonuclease Cas2